MDGQKDPVDILDEIMSRSEKPLPPPIPYPPQFDPPPEDSPPPAPEEKKPTPAERLLPWLGVLLGGAVLAALVLGFQLFSVNARLDGLQAAIGEIRAVDELQKEVDDLENQLKQAEEADQETDQRLWENYEQISDLSRQKCSLDYLWHIGQFMEQEDYPMAALAAAYSFGTFSGNLIQEAQYETYLRELSERGYLKLLNRNTVEFSATWDPSENPYMAAIGILWCALDQYYVQGNPGNAAGILFAYQYDSLGNEFPGSIPYPQWLRNSASEYALVLYAMLRADLAAQDYLVVVEDGALKCGPALYAATDANGEGIRTDLPFDLPGHSGLPEDDIGPSIPE